MLCCPRPSLFAGVWLVSFGTWLLASCATGRAGEPGVPPAEPAWLPDLAVSEPPFDEVHVNWKDRLPSSYVFLDHLGSYTETGRLLMDVAAAMKDQELEPSGPPFALYYDDPGRVPTAQLRSRACFPVRSDVLPSAPLEQDVLPGGTVVYAFAAGAYPEVPRSYPALFGFMDGLGWVENGPIREIYLVNPAEARSFDELVTEVQVPATNGQR